MSNDLNLNTNLFNIDDLFLTIKENLLDNQIIDNIINNIKENFFEFEYNELIVKLMQNLDDEIFIISFINPLINKLNTYRNVILTDIIKLTNNILHLKNIFLIDYAGFEQMYAIYKTKKISNNMFSDILFFIYNLGKIDILINLIEFIYKTKINYEIIYNIVISFMIFHVKLFNEDIRDYNNYFKDNYKNITNILLEFTNTILYQLFELNDYITYTFKFDTKTFLTEDNMNIIENFFINILNKIEHYYDISLIKNIIQYIEILSKHNFYQNMYELTYIMIKFIDNDILNIHDKTSLLLKLCKFMASDSYKQIPNNTLYYVNYYLSNVKFLEWSTFDEKISIIIMISKLLFKLYQNNNINNKDLYSSLLYNIIYYEKESVNIIEYVLQNNITFNTYTILKETIYGLINTLNIFVELEIYLCCKLNTLIPYEEYDYILYKNNLNLTSYVMFLLKNENLYKFNTQTLIHNFIVSKYVMIYNQMLYDKLPYIGLDYDKIKEYYDTYYIKSFSELFMVKLNILEQQYNDMNKFIDENPDSYLIDPIFTIKIQNVYKLPKSNEKFEKITLRLLIKESSKNPFTREALSLIELDKFNQQI